MKGSSRKGGRPATWIGGGGLDPKQLAGLGIPQLKALFQEIFGQPTSSNNAKWLRHKLAQPPRPGNSCNPQPHGGRSLAPLPPINHLQASAKHSSPSSEHPLFPMDHAPVPEHESLASLACPRLHPGHQHISMHEYAIEQDAADATATLHQRPQGSRMTSKRKTCSSADLAAAAGAAEAQRPTRRAKVPGLEPMSAELHQQQVQERGTAAAAMTSCNGLDVHRSPSNGSSSEWWQHSEDPMLLGAEAASQDVVMGDAPVPLGHHGWYGEAGADVLSWASELPLSTEDHWESLGQPFGQHSFESSSTEVGLPGYYGCGPGAGISMADGHMGSRGMLPGLHLQRSSEQGVQQGGFRLHQASSGTGHLPSWPEQTGTVTTCQAWSDYRAPRSDAAAAAAVPATGTFSITHGGLRPPLGQPCMAPPQLTPEDESLRLAGPSMSMARASCLAPDTLQGNEAVAPLGCEDPLLDMLFSDWGINGPATGCGKVETPAWNTAGQPQPQLAWGTQGQHWLD